MTDSRRLAIVEWAKHEASVAGDGSHRDEYMKASCLNPADHPEWCGIFTLAALKANGVGLDVCWEVGIGYVGPQHLTITKDPLPGDISYKDQPFQHYGLVAAPLGPNGELDSVEGNAPGVKVLHHPSPSGVIYYSIDKLLERAGAAPALPKVDGSRQLYYLQLSAVSSTRDIASLGVGSQGRLVREIQYRLGIKTDGVWGPVTENAVRKMLGIDAD